MIFFLQIQDTIPVDTTSLGYKIGFTLGSWLPFIIIVIIVLLILRKRYRFDKE